MTYDFVKNNTVISPIKRMRKRDYKRLGTSIIYTLRSIQSLLAFRVVAPLKWTNNEII